MGNMTNHLNMCPYDLDPFSPHYHVVKMELAGAFLAHMSLRLIGVLLVYQCDQGGQ